MVVDIQQKNQGKIPIIGVPIKLSETPGTIRTPPVDFGESTVSILQELGYNEDQIKAFADKGVY
jgi:crotonobetainyl-CoA:carnitine CoA-transferase CaiB-like acyl-CoA transferase